MFRMLNRFRAAGRSPLISRAVSLLDTEWYERTYPDVLLSGFDASTHFARFGFFEGRNPNPLFEADWYRHEHGLPSHANCLQHYLIEGFRAGHNPSVYLDSEWYRSKVRELAPDVTPLEHYWIEGWRRLIDPHPLFDSVWYLEQKPEGLRVDQRPVVHFLIDGGREGLSPSPLFMPAAYNEINPDVAWAGIDPFVHFLKWGVEEGRRTSEMVDGATYVKRYPDDELVRAWGTEAHYARFGRAEGRKISNDPLAEKIVSFVSSRADHARTFATSPDYGVSSVDPFDWPRRAEAVQLSTSTAPRVSVIIPTFNHADDVIRCVESISQIVDHTPFEVIVVDDASKVGEHELMARLTGVRFVRLTENRGFAGACQAGVDASVGEFILLLNNDTEVTSGWIDALVDEMDSHLSTGIAGSMILRADCKLQEAGGIMWSDGTGAHYASGEWPTKGFARYRRMVDFCSGASLLIRRSVWELIGGFDPDLAPAYYEDVDVSFAARLRGFETVYVPESVILHREGSSHGRGSFGLKRRQFVNRETFASKWSNELVSHGESRGVDDWSSLAARDRRRSRHVLVCDHEHLDPTADAGSVRMDAILRGLVDLGFVVHFYPAGLLRSFAWVDSISRYGVEVMEIGSDLGPFFWSFRDDLEFIVVSRPSVMGELASVISLHAPQVPLMYDMVDAHGLRLRRKAAITGNAEDFEHSRHSEAVERRSARLADVTIAVSQAEVDHISDLAGVPLRTLVIPTIHAAVDHVDGFDNREGILFVGGFQHDPNVDAVKFLVHEIMPRVVARIGRVPVTIVGSKPTKEIEELRSESVNVLGWVEDLEPIYAKHRYVVAALRYGAGVKGKIGEALSHGVPVVTTSVGIEGYDVVHGRDLLVGDSADELAELIATNYSNRTKWEQLSSAGAEAVERTAGRGALLQQLEQMVSLASDVRRR